MCYNVIPIYFVGDGNNKCENIEALKVKSKKENFLGVDPRGEGEIFFL
jgi:hypothetical protein